LSIRGEETLHEPPVDTRTVLAASQGQSILSPTGSPGIGRVLVILGTRPEAIKLAPVVKELSAQPDLCCNLCVTGQHRELLLQVLDLFELEPDWNLDIMRPDQDLAYLTSAALSGISNVLSSSRPDRVIVQGDTTTTLAGALAAFYHRIPVAHIEAGLRTDNIYAPWPEEVNRRLVSRIADLHFAPTVRARDNLEREGIAHEQIIVTGNTGIDALLWVSKLLDGNRELRSRGEALLSDFVEGKRLILMTGHRRESLDGGLARICNAMIKVASRPDVAVIFPVHPNPNVRRTVEPLRQYRNIRLVEPVDYPELVFLLKHCHFVVTDSGGIQEEAPSFGKPVLVTRDNTERPEAMEQGLAKLVGNDEWLLYDEMCALLDHPRAYARMSRVENPYGDGRASRRIAGRLLMETVVPASAPYALPVARGGAVPREAFALDRLSL
jgi:UDP-N-acetylglucosamine 2-epimerase